MAADDNLVTPEPEDIVSPESPADSPVSDGQTLQTVVELIKSYLATIERNKKELGEMRTMLKDGFATDKTYLEQDEAVKSATKIRNATKQQLLKQPQLVQLADKVKDATAALKEAKDSLSDYLQEYQRLTGSTEIEDENGEVNQIVYTARLVKPNSKFVR